MAISGRGGAVKFSSSTSGNPTSVAEIRSWTLNVSNDLLETPVFGSSQWRRFAPNLAGAQGTISGYFDSASTEQRFIMNQILTLSTDPAGVELYVNETAQDGFAGDVWVTQVNPQAAADGTVDYAANFTFQGAVTFSTTLS